MEESEVLRGGEFTNHPHHGEKYDELLPYNLGDFDEFDPFLVEERRTTEDCDNFAFSMIIYCNDGGRYHPYYEIQHDPRNEYPESPDLTQVGMRIWDLNPQCKRVQNFELNMESDLATMTNQDCYDYVKNEFETILASINDVYGQFKRPVMQS